MLPCFGEEPDNDISNMRCGLCLNWFTSMVYMVVQCS
jgi:hypothetical protein